MAKAPPNPFYAFVSELFEGLGEVTVKRMFGGAGGYAEGVMFALIAADVIYIKVDDAMRADLEAEGSGPFIWEPANGPRAGEKQPMMGYWRLPDAAMDEPDLAASWGRRALDVALAAKAKKPKKRAKKREAKRPTPQSTT